MTLRFWRWLRAYCERLIRSYASHERLCPNCLQWSSVVGVVRYRDLDVVHSGMTCGSCGYESKWDMVRSMLPELASETLAKDRLAAVKQSPENQKHPIPKK